MLRTNLTMVVMCLFLVAAAGRATAEDGVDPLFASDELLHVEIEAPFNMLASKRPDEEEFPGKFRYTSEDGELVEFDIVLRTRGRLRRNRQVCGFPPFRLNFKKGQVADTLFDKQDKLKLVSHCRNYERAYKQAVIAEYLVYRMLNLLTERSFRVRLLQVNYVFSDKKRNIENYAVLIEPKERLEKRLGGKTTKTERVEISELQPEDLNLVSIFQYFIGNTDFSPIASVPDKDCCHNQILLKRKEGLHLTVPYDFDQAGMVDAPHASPNPRFDIESARDRLYRGRCVNNEHLPATLDLFRNKRADIESLINNQTELDKKKSKSMLQFIRAFYATINDQPRLERSITEKCI